MTPKITPEQRQALRQHAGQPIEVEDDSTQKVYLLIARENFPQIVDEELRRQLQIGFDQADAGDVADWDMDEMLTEAHRRHSDLST
jgi:hypothetical protein